MAFGFLLYSKLKGRECRNNGGIRGGRGHVTNNGGGNAIIKKLLEFKLLKWLGQVTK